MQIIKTNEIGKIAAQIVANKIKELSKVKENIIVAVPGGRSSASIFLSLNNLNLPWKRIHWFMVDERIGKIADKERNFKILKDNLTKAENLHPFLIDNGIKKYEEELKEYQDNFDIVLLSAGEDGHIASLFPNHQSIEDDSEFFIRIDDAPKLPIERMSASRLLLERSGMVILLFSGETKRQAYENFSDKKVSVEQCPAKLVKIIDESYLLTDLT